jgi:cell division transport system ATP-binding protein
MKIKFDQVGKKFGEITAIEDVNLKINEGDFVFITGRSGAGKTTILKLILGEYKPTSGEVWVAEKNLNQTRPKEILQLRRSMGVIYQDYRLLNYKTVRENILVALDVVGDEKGDRQKRLEEVLNIVGLDERINFFPAQLSGGELQRVCLARALITEPNLIMADEPTGNLDPETGWELMNLLKKINEQGTTVIMSTHDFDIVNSMDKPTIKLEKGKRVDDLEDVDLDTEEPEEEELDIDEEEEETESEDQESEEKEKNGKD